MAVFLFTDIEGSTQLWEKYPQPMSAALSRHDAIFTHFISRHHGRIIKHTGDGIFAIFESGDPIQCALDVQRRVAGESWGELGELRVRMALHAGDAERRGDDYFGPVINRTARLLAAGWGGQILLTPEVMSGARLPDEAELRDLGVHLLKDLSEAQRVYDLRHPALPAREFPALRTLSIRPHNLPPQSTPFVGRDRELSEVVSLLADPTCRALTLIGPGGVGKTRLSLQAAAEQIETFANGVYFVPLAALATAEFLDAAIADALKFSFYSAKDLKLQLLSYLREKSLLLVLDNFEHLLDGARLVEEILQAAPQVKVLATSRERLNIGGERTLEVGGLDYPGESVTEDVERYGAVRLFVQNARRAHPGFALNTGERPEVVRICRLVEGMPLGIELASAWTAVLPCAEIAAQIERNIGFLASDKPDEYGRYRSLQATFDYFWDFLSEGEQAVLSRLSVFRGGFSGEAAQAVAGASFFFLSALVERSFLRKTASGRYELHELLRQYAAERLLKRPTELAAAQDSHSAHYTEFLARREAPLKRGGHQPQTLQEIEREIENVRAAWGWSVKGGQLAQIETASEALFQFYDLKSRYEEGVQAFTAALEVSAAADNLLTSKLLVRQAWFLFRLSHNTTAQGIIKQALVEARQREDEVEVSYILSRLGHIHWQTGHYADAKRYYEECLELSQKIGDRSQLRSCVSGLGMIAIYHGEYERANQLHQESLKISRQLGDRWGEGIDLLNLGVVAYEQGDNEEARRWYEESLAIRRELGDRWGEASCLNNLANVVSTYEADKTFPQTRRLYEESLHIFRDIGYRSGAAACLSNLGSMSVDLGHFAEGRMALEEALAIQEEIGDRRGMAISLVNLAEVSRKLEDDERCKQYVLRALKAGQEMELVPIIFLSLADWAYRLAKNGAIKQAVELLSFIVSAPTATEEGRVKAREMLSDLAAEIPSEMFDAAGERGPGLNLDSVIADILTELEQGR